MSLEDHKSRGAIGDASRTPKSPFDIDIGQRILLCLLSPIIMIAAFAGCIEVFRWHPPGIRMLLLKVVLAEGASAVALLSSAVFVYALAKPRWARSLIEGNLLKVLIFGLGVLFVIILGLLSALGRP